VTEYYRFLARSLFELREKDFWKFHRSSLKKLVHKFSVLRLIFTLFSEVVGNSRTVARIFKRTITKKFREHGLSK